MANVFTYINKDGKELKLDFDKERIVDMGDGSYIVRDYSNPFTFQKHEHVVPKNGKYVFKDFYQYVRTLNEMTTGAFANCKLVAKTADTPLILVDKKFKKLAQFDELLEITDGYISAKKNGQFVAIDRTGKVINLKDKELTGSFTFNNKDYLTAGNKKEQDIVDKKGKKVDTAMSFRSVMRGLGVLATRKTGTTLDVVDGRIELGNVVDVKEKDDYYLQIKDDKNKIKYVDAIGRVTDKEPDMSAKAYAEFANGFKTLKELKGSYFRSKAFRTAVIKTLEKRAELKLNQADITQLLKLDNVETFKTMLNMLHKQYQLGAEASKNMENER